MWPPLPWCLSRIVARYHGYEGCHPVGQRSCVARHIILGLFKYIRQNKLRVTPRSKQCNSIFSQMPGLLPISDSYDNLTADTLWSDEQFPVKKYFVSTSLIFEISKILIFNPKSVIKNFYSLWLVNHFSIRLVKRAFINRFFTTLGAYSDSRRFFQDEISPVFFDRFPKSWWSAPKICNCDFEFAWIYNYHCCIVCQNINDSIRDWILLVCFSWRYELQRVHV